MRFYNQRHEFYYGIDLHARKMYVCIIDSYKIAKLLMTYPYPAKKRATRDLLRRRTHLVRQHGLRLAYIQSTNTQYNLPSFDG